MQNKMLLNELNQINRKDKEKLLMFLLNLEMQDKLHNQEPVFSSPQKDD